LRVLEIEPSDPRWEAFAREHPDAIIYHHPSWLHVLESEYGHQSLCLACEDGDGELQGILPLAWTRGVPVGSTVRTGRRLSSLPRTPMAGPLSLHEEATACLIDAAIEHVRDAHGARLELKPSWTCATVPATGLSGLPWRKAYVVELSAEAAGLRFGNSRNRARLKWAVRKASRFDVQVRVAETHEELRTWYRLYLETMRTHLMPPRPFRLFDAMWNVLGPRGLMRLLVAEHHRRLIAGSIYLTFGATTFYAFNGSRRSELWLRPNDLIHWRAIEDFRREGFRYYDLGEVATGNLGLADFKTKWGSTEVQLHRYYYPRPAVKSLEETPRAPTGSRRLIEKGWRLVPLRATAALGDAIYRFL
jgi:CelD/BcsL family acetyltransferase involved in cellulose biosynthesis